MRTDNRHGRLGYLQVKKDIGTVVGTPVGGFGAVVGRGSEMSVIFSAGETLAFLAMV